MLRLGDPYILIETDPGAEEIEGVTGGKVTLG